MKKSLEEYFFSKVRKTEACWLWTGSKNAKGYGQMWLGSKASAMAHRWAFEFFTGKSPEGLLVCHKCDVPGCVNPDHLFLGTHTDNMQDMRRKGRGVHQKKTHCPQGHLYGAPNSKGWRYCDICNANASRKRWQKRKPKVRTIVAGCDHHRAKLSLKQIEYIKANYVFDSRTRRSNANELAARFSVNRSCIQRALKRTVLSSYEKAKAEGEK